MRCSRNGSASAAEKSPVSLFKSAFFFFFEGQQKVHSFGLYEKELKKKKKRLKSAHAQKDNAPRGVKMKWDFFSCVVHWFLFSHDFVAANRFSPNSLTGGKFLLDLPEKMLLTGQLKAVQKLMSSQSSLPPRTAHNMRSSVHSFVRRQNDKNDWQVSFGYRIKKKTLILFFRPTRCEIWWIDLHRQ